MKRQKNDAADAEAIAEAASCPTMRFVECFNACLRDERLNEEVIEALAHAR